MIYELLIQILWKYMQLFLKNMIQSSHYFAHATAAHVKICDLIR